MSDIARSGDLSIRTGGRWEGAKGNWCNKVVLEERNGVGKGIWFERFESEAVDEAKMSTE